MSYGYIHLCRAGARILLSAAHSYILFGAPKLTPHTRGVYGNHLHLLFPPTSPGYVHVCHREYNIALITGAKCEEEPGSDLPTEQSGSVRWAGLTDQCTRRFLAVCRPVFNVGSRY